MTTQKCIFITADGDFTASLEIARIDDDIETEYKYYTDTTEEVREVEK